MFKGFIFCILLCFSINYASSQIITDTLRIDETLETKDSLLFNIGFNNCDASQFEKLISENFEFYHDQGGTANSKAEFIAGIKDGLCKLPYKPRRILVERSLKVYPIKKNGVVIGAIQTGKHKFYARKKNKRWKRTSTAKFTHIWLLENGEWKLSRGFSYDHR